MNQRWFKRLETYRPADEIIATHQYEVAEIADDNTPKKFVMEHHYSGSYPAARFRYGLYTGGKLVGVAVFSHPCNNKVLTGVFPVDAREAVELGRFVLLDSVPGNGETWFIARCFELLRNEVAGVVSYSDPIAREAATGHTVHPGHVGTIYQASNARYLGLSKARTLLLLPDGTVFSERAVQKVRKREKGWRYAVATLVAAGAESLELGDADAWLKLWLPRLTRKLRHPGNHKYAWGLDRSLKKHLLNTTPVLAYPKKEIARLCVTMRAAG